MNVTIYGRLYQLLDAGCNGRLRSRDARDTQAAGTDVRANSGRDLYRDWLLTRGEERADHLPPLGQTIKVL